MSKTAQRRETMYHRGLWDGRRGKEFALKRGTPMISVYAAGYWQGKWDHDERKVRMTDPSKWMQMVKDKIGDLAFRDMFQRRRA